VEIALGTVQFGLPYGIAGAGAVVPAAAARRIFEAAHANGIRVLDTATAYGDIEERLGALCAGLDFKFVSKIPPLPAGASERAAIRFVSESLERSWSRLGAGLKAMLFHRAEDLWSENSEPSWATAATIAESRGFELGVSCYEPDEVAPIRGRFPIAVAQLPGNALDQRVVAAGAAGSFVGLEIHMRSVFLQGLLLMSDEQVRTRLPIAVAAVGRWRRWCAERGLSQLRGALALAKGMAGVRYAVVGVDTSAHLEAILREWDSVQPIRAQELSCDVQAIIDPRRWSAA
jgi:aryl-alcohol dehydrogenase-like predicted oxidoreductase